MSGTSIVYGDRPIANVQGTGVYATFEFLQYLERLTRSHGALSGAAPELVAQVATNTGNIVTLTQNVANLAAEDAATANRVQVLYGITAARFPAVGGVDIGFAVPLTSGTIAQIGTAPALHGANIVVGTVYLTGTGTVTLASISTGPTSGVIETASGAFATGWFGGGASPTTLGVDLSIGSVMQVMILPDNDDAPAYLNARATFTGAISAYGSLIVLPFGTFRR